MKEIKRIMTKIPLQIHTQPPRQYGTKIFYTKLVSDLSQKNTAITDILQLLKDRRIIQNSDEIWVRLCLDEVLVNAIRHGNKENIEKNVEISIYIDKKHWAIRVEDEGEGFSPENLIALDSQEYWESEHGRGILLMKNYMDEIWYYDKGNRVQLAKFHKNIFQKIWQKLFVFFSKK